ncbi:ATP-binding protein [Photobacterium leiognathi]|uniref:ATP-binding protein n=1 Tax=Photobacterium leiognathi TaxID=553611 RepID=UPI002980DAA9|nr:ATP-binding protein [Photobacterium leiognathi]
MSSKTVRLEIGTCEENQLKTLSSLFPDKNIIIQELVQNAYRANATKIEIHVNDETKTFSIEDNGIGIRDFSDFFTTMNSGWSEETKNQNNAFGIGGLGIIFASDYFSISSLGKKIEAECNAVLDNKTLERESLKISDDDFIQGTKITLHNYKFNNIHGSLGEILECFPISITGTSHHRKHLYSKNCEYITTPITLDSLSRNSCISKPYLEINHPKQFLITTEYGNAYLDPDLKIKNNTRFCHQGFKVNGSTMNIPFCSVIHFDNQSVKGSYPIRASIVDRLELDAYFCEKIEERVKQLLPNLLKELGEPRFIEKYFEAAIKYAPELITKSIWVSSQQLVPLRDYYHSKFQNIYACRRENKTYKIDEDFLNKNIIIKNIDHINCAHLLTDYALQEQKNIFVFQSHQIDDPDFILNKHAHQFEINSIDGELFKPCFADNNRQYDLYPTQNLVASTSLGKIKVITPLIIGEWGYESLNDILRSHESEEPENDEKNYVHEKIFSNFDQNLLLRDKGVQYDDDDDFAILLVTANTTVNQYLLLQCHSYLDSNDHLVESELYDDEKYLNTLIKSIYCTDKTEALQAIIDQHIRTLPTHLRDIENFNLTVSEDGILTVETIITK